jgi:hypothetical protein
MTRVTWPNEPPREEQPNGAWARPDDGTAPDSPPPPVETFEPPATAEPYPPPPAQPDQGPAESDESSAGRPQAAPPYQPPTAGEGYPTGPYRAPPTGQPPASTAEPAAGGTYQGTGQGPVYQPYPGQQAYPPPLLGASTTNGLAIAALVCSLAGVVTVISAPVGAVLGHLALRVVGRTGQVGRSLAIAAIWVGWVITGLVLLGCCGVIALWRTAVPMR